MSYRANAMLNLLFVLLLGATSVATGAGVSVIDDTGAAVPLERPAQRIVSLAPAATELLFAIGVGHRLVGVSDYSDYPPAAHGLPRIGGGHGLDLERILALKPDLVVGWQSGNPGVQLDRIERLGLPLYRSEPRRLDDVATNMERLGILAGQAEQAQRAAHAYRDRLTGMRQRYAGKTEVDVLYVIWHRPLMTVTAAHLISDVISLCGGRNVFGELPGLAVTIDIEAVLAANPSLVISGTHDGQRPVWADDWSQWTSLTAVQRDAFHGVSADLLHRQTPRILDGVDAVCRAIDGARRQQGS